MQHIERKLEIAAKKTEKNLHCTYYVYLYIYTVHVHVYIKYIHVCTHMYRSNKQCKS